MEGKSLKNLCWNYIWVRSAADPDPVGSEPFGSDPIPINCPDPVTTIKSKKNKKENLIS